MLVKNCLFSKSYSTTPAIRPIPRVGPTPRSKHKFIFTKTKCRSRSKSRPTFYIRKNNTSLDHNDLLSSLDHACDRVRAIGVNHENEYDRDHIKERPHVRDQFLHLVQDFAQN